MKLLLAASIIIALALVISLSQPVPDHTASPLTTNQLEKIFPLSK